jgi:hypothetical protein
METTRSHLAFWLIGLLMLMIIFSGLAALVTDAVAFERVKVTFQYAFGPVTALLGTAIGFYFRGKV